MDSQIKGNLEDRLVRYTGTIRDIRNAMQSDGYVMPTTAEIAEVVSDCTFPCSGVSMIVAETVNYFPKKGYILIASGELNPVLPHLDGSPISHWRKLFGSLRGNDFYLSRGEQRELLSIAEEDKEKSPRERRVFRWDNAGYFRMRREALCGNKTQESELAKFLYKGETRKFTRFLKDNGVAHIPFWLDNKNQIDGHRAPYARLLTFTVRSEPWNAHLLDGTHTVYADSMGTCAIKPSS